MASESPDVTKAPKGHTPDDEAARLDRPSSFSLDIERRGVLDAMTGYVFRLRTGEPGALPAVLGLIILGLIFWRVSDNGSFFTKNNIGNLPGQGAYIAIIGLGLVFVLLLGEIDLSAGTLGGMVAGLAAQAVFSNNLHKAVPGGIYWSIVIGMIAMIILGIYVKAYSASLVVAVGVVIILTNLDHHVIGAMIAAIGFGVAVGILDGVLVAKVGIPSFIVTLAVFIAWQGVLLFELKSQPIGTTNYSFWQGLSLAFEYSGRCATAQLASVGRWKRGWPSARES